MGDEVQEGVLGWSRWSPVNMGVSERSDGQARTPLCCWASQIITKASEYGLVSTIARQLSALIRLIVERERCSASSVVGCVYGSNCALARRASLILVEGVGLQRNGSSRACSPHHHDSSHRCHAEWTKVHYVCVLAS